MKRKRTYQSEHVESVRLEEVLPMLMTGCIVALDVAKTKFMVALATLAGEVVKLLRFEHPTDTRRFLELAEELRSRLGNREVRVAMEPTGTYGDAVRHQLANAGFAVCMVSPKRTYDCREVFDAVPSLHDPKSATLVAKLCAMGLTKPYAPALGSRTRLRALVDLRRHEEDVRERCLGRLEAQLARHWPELGRWMNVREHKTALHLLAEYGGPVHVAMQGAAARDGLRRASRGRLAAEVLDGIVESARTTLGVPMFEEQIRLVRNIATQAQSAGETSEALDAELARFAEHDPVYAALAKWMGSYTAAVLVTMCDVDRYTNAGQLEKACGLNLREKSSGEHRGQLAITKRGPALVRQVLFMFALRTIHSSPVVRAWYERRRGHTETSKLRAVVAVMRKLVRAAFYVAKGEAFDETKLFDVRRLQSSSPASAAKTRVRVNSRSTKDTTKPRAPSAAATS